MQDRDRLHRPRDSYSAIVNHKMRKDILRTLYRMALNGPLSKQEIADELQIDYHQLIYQLNNHLREFWSVKEELKRRGTRVELIAPSKPYVIFISLGGGAKDLCLRPPCQPVRPAIQSRCEVRYLLQRRSSEMHAVHQYWVRLRLCLDSRREGDIGGEWQEG